VSLADQDPRHNETLAQQKPVIWNDCDIYKTDTADEVAVMGYSMRTSNYRYTAWIYVSRPDFYPNWTQPLFAEELYDHKKDTLGDLGHRELVNMARKDHMQVVLLQHRKTLVNIIKRSRRILLETKVNDEY
jgi:hypothetical protein